MVCRNIFLACLGEASRGVKTDIPVSWPAGIFFLQGWGVAPQGVRANLVVALGAEISLWLVQSAASRGQLRGLRD